jgi:cobalt-zinc-cadmium efflux system membrane fusion protein
MLKPGMFAKIEVRVPLGEPVSMVPREAVISDEGASFVFVRWKDDFWVRRNVVVGRGQGRFVEIIDGVADADTVAVSGGFMLKSDVLRTKMGAGCAD